MLDPVVAYKDDGTSLGLRVGKSFDSAAPILLIISLNFCHSPVHDACQSDLFFDGDRGVGVFGCRFWS